MRAFCGQTQKTEQSLSKLSSVLIRKTEKASQSSDFRFDKTSDSARFCVNRREINKSSDF